MREFPKNAVYQKILIDLERRIRHGFFEESMPLPSLKQLCLTYNISYMTACRVYAELQKLGIVYGIKGKGFFIAEKHMEISSSQEGAPRFPLRGIVAFYTENAGSTGIRQEAKLYVKGIMERSAELQVPCRSVNLCGQGSIQVEEGEGTILVYNTANIWIMQMLKLRRIRTVLLNNFHSEAFCVVNDNYHGMACIMDSLQQRGCSRILLCSRHFSDLGLANLSERTHAFVTECERRGVSGHLLPSGDYEELLDICHSGTRSPDAVIFLTIESALVFFRKLKTKKIRKQPVFAAFGSDVLCPFPIVTYSENVLDMGRAAVDLIVNNAPEDWMLPEIVRVRGTFSGE